MTSALAVAGRTARGVETLALRALHPDSHPGEAAASGISAAARNGRVWAGMSAALALHPPSRRAARDAMAAWAGAEGLAFAAKAVVGRRRPRWVPAIGGATRSSSMPSSHTAAALAYATAATLGQPAVGAVALPLAVSVAWARAATARHFPTDVLAGAALGVGTGAAVHLAARRLDRLRAPQGGNDPSDRSPSTGG